MDAAARGAAVLSTNPNLAVSLYTKALIEHPTSPDYYIQRSTAFTRLKDPLSPRYDLALEDAELAVLLAQKRAKREKIQAAQQRRVVALFGLQQYGDAAMVLETMEKWRAKDSRKDQMEGDMWKQKIEQRTRELDQNDDKLVVRSKEYPEMDIPSEAELKEILQEELNDEDVYKFDPEPPQLEIDTQLPENGKSEPRTPGGSLIGNLTEITSDGADDETDSIPPKAIKVERSASIVHSVMSPISATSGNPSASRPSQSSSSTVQSKIRHEWYQNPQMVYITIYAKGVPKEKADIEITEDSIFASFPHPADSSRAYTFSLDPLFAPVDPESSTSTILSTKIEIVLSKKIPGQKWASLEHSGPDAGQSTVSTSTFSDTKSQVAATPAYPTSSKGGPKDWDKLASDLTAKAKAKKEKKAAKEKKPENEAGSDEDGDSGIESDYGGDPVDGFFKKLYAGADDDTRRAMMKSYQESGGTSLSTNWSEVGKGPVEPVKGSDD